MTPYPITGAAFTTPGAMLSRTVEASVIVLFVITVGDQPASLTTASYDSVHLPDDTTAGSIAAQNVLPALPTAKALLEIRRLSGLTWDELAEIFNVSRRSIHNWINGEVVAAKHDHIVRQVLDVMRAFNGAWAKDTRAALLTSNLGGSRLYDLLRAGEFERAMIFAATARPLTYSSNLSSSRRASIRVADSAVAVDERPIKRSVGKVRTKSRGK